MERDAMKTGLVLDRCNKDDYFRPSGTDGRSNGLSVWTMSPKLIYHTQRRKPSVTGLNAVLKYSAMISVFMADQEEQDPCLPKQLPQRKL